MRDMEQLRERGDDGVARKIGVYGLAVAAGLGLIFAIGVLIGNAADADDAVPEEDPLARLDRAAGLEAGSTENDAVPTVERESLTFPEALEDSRPEVESAVAAAGAEEAHPDPIEGGSTVAAALAAGDDEDEPRAVDPLAHPGLPAAVSATPAREELARAIIRDPLVAAALPDAPEGHRAAPSGRDGEYTLQVSSLPTPAMANAFCDQLRARGHRAFVVVADVPNRGRHWRVRIGPFETMGEAESYRREFENSERMNTYVVRRQEQEGPIGD